MKVNMEKFLILLLYFGLVGCAFVFAQGEYSNREEAVEEIEEAMEDIEEIMIEWASDRLDEINERLLQPLRDKEKAEFLYEKSILMFETFGAYYLRTATESLLEAIELTPDNEEYKEYLSQVYDVFWKDREFNDQSIMEGVQILKVLKEKVRIIVESYRGGSR